MPEVPERTKETYDFYLPYIRAYRGTVATDPRLMRGPNTCSFVRGVPVQPGSVLSVRIAITRDHGLVTRNKTRHA